MSLVRVLGLTGALLVGSPLAYAQEAATPADVVAQVRAAAALLAADSEAGLATIRDPGSPFVFKDSYVFASDCGSGVILAHPIQPERDGKPIADGAAYSGVTAAERAKAQCTVGTAPGGGWYAYPFPKPGTTEPSRKISYLLPVPGTTWIVGAGIHDDAMTIEELQQITANTP
jgi:cytochrome c